MKFKQNYRGDEGSLRPRGFLRLSPALLGNQCALDVDRNGFAYIPHFREPIDGDITYGDTSMSIDWLSREFPEWKIEATDCSPEDPYQLRVFLPPG